MHILDRRSKMSLVWEGKTYLWRETQGPYIAIRMLMFWRETQAAYWRDVLFNMPRFYSICRVDQPNRQFFFIFFAMFDASILIFCGQNPPKFTERPCHELGASRQKETGCIRRGARRAQEGDEGAAVMCHEFGKPMGKACENDLQMICFLQIEILVYRRAIQQLRQKKSLWRLTWIFDGPRISESNNKIWRYIGI